MEICKLFLVMMLTVCVAVAGDMKDVNILPGPPMTSELPPTTPAPPKPSPTPPTKPTTSATTTSTLPPTTSKVTTTSTVPPTTSKVTPTTTTTTSKPITTTAPTTPTPTTAPPTPVKPEVGTWNVTVPATNYTCIIAKMAMEIDIEHLEKDANKTVIYVPAKATANGACKPNVQDIKIEWTNKTAGNASDYVYLRFVKNNKTDEVSLDYLSVVINGVHADNETGPLLFVYNHTEFQAPLKHSYKCNKEQVLTLTRSAPAKSNCTATFKVSSLQVQAFMNSTKPAFDDAIDCLNSSTPDIVPIAVGCALAALVVVVLLAYLYGRRRSQARGYLSMVDE